MLSNILMNEFHPYLNGGIDPNLLGKWSKQTVWWLGACKHEWQTSVSKRTEGNNCPICAGKQLLTGFNDLQTKSPLINQYWHPTKNSPLKAEEILAHSNKTFWLMCEHEHEYLMVAKNYMKLKDPSFCPECQKLNLRARGLEKLSSSLQKEWHPTKNTLLAVNVSPQSSKKAWWVCDKGHEWEVRVANRSIKNQECPYCLGDKLLIGFNDLLSIEPALANELHPFKNNLISLTQIIYTSKNQVWWLGKCGHEWEDSPNNRLKGRSCPYCAGRKVLDGFNDLATLRPKLAKEWNFEKNSNTPNSFSISSAVKVWWICEKGHEWEAVIYSRNYGSGCPFCNSSNKNSTNEKEIFNFLLKFVDAEQSNRKILNGKELDIYIPEKKFAIEFNGLYWHTEEKGKDKTYHYNKWFECKEQGIQLIQIWEDDWNRNPNLIKNMLAHKLGFTSQKKVFARKTKIKLITIIEAKNFFYSNHIQGFASGSYYLGLVDEKTSELYGALILKKEPNTQGKTLNIIRYATSVNVIGGFTKLLSYAKKTYAPEKFITFSDNCISDGGLYKNNGFTIDKELNPDYMYLVKGIRRHKFGYRLVKFKNNIDLKYVEGLTEIELAKLNNLPRIWDAGKIRWVLTCI